MKPTNFGVPNAFEPTHHAKASGGRAVRPQLALLAGTSPLVQWRARVLKEIEDVLSL